MYNVYKYFEAEKRQGFYSHRLDAVTAKTASAMGVSDSTIRDIAKKAPNFDTPGKKRKSVKSRQGQVDDFDKCTIRRIVYRFFPRKELPTLDTLHVAVKNDLDFEYSKEYLRQILHELGFVYRRRKNNTHFIERSDIVCLRREYLRKIRRAREQSKNIIYLDETWVNQGYAREHSWQDTVAQDNPRKPRRMV